MVGTTVQGPERSPLPTDENRLSDPRWVSLPQCGHGRIKHGRKILDHAINIYLRPAHETSDPYKPSLEPFLVKVPPMKGSIRRLPGRRWIPAFAEITKGVMRQAEARARGIAVYL